MSPNEINTHENRKTSTLRKRPFLLAAAAIALIALPAGIASAQMRNGGGYGQGYGAQDCNGSGGYRMGGGGGRFGGNGMRGPGRYHGYGMRGGQRGQMFDQLDANGDGKVTAEEITAARSARFAAIDSNGDGQVSLKEVAALKDAMRTARGNMMAARRLNGANGFVAADTDGNGTISAEEFAAMPNRMLDRFDADGDGAVTKDEIRDQFGKGRGPRGTRSE